MHRTRSRTRNCNKEVILLHQAFCDYCSSIEGEPELSRNKHRTTYTNQYTYYCTFTLKRVHTQTGLDSITYISMYPTGCVPPRFYGHPKNHKPDTPLRPIVSSCGSVTCCVAKELTKILKPLVGKSPHLINSTHDCVEQVKQLIWAPGECLSSYDVSTLFTSVPVDLALGVIKDLLENDATVKNRTVLQVKDIIKLLEFCFKKHTFHSKTSSMNRSRVQLWVPSKSYCS